MGVADNKSYKNMYHFTGKYYQNNPSKLPSLENDNPKINDSIKDNPYFSNVEIEKGEVVLNPDMGALFQAKGKKHSQGGTEVYLKGGSFVFSDDKSLSITDNEKDLFDLKSSKSSTPASILKKNVDTKHYNLLIQNLLDPKKDDLSKRSSSLMLEKYTEKIGQVGYLQEMKKNFPDGIPFFSKNTAPVVDPDLKEDIMVNKQYMKYGGNILSKFQNGGQYLDFLKRISEFDDNQKENFNKMFPNIRNLYKNKGLRNTLPSTIVSKLDEVGEFLNSPYISKKEKNTIVPENSEQFTTKLPNKNYISGVPEKKYTGNNNLKVSIVPGEIGYNYPDPIPNKIDQNSIDSLDYNWEFTPYQKESQGYNLLKALSVKRYMPYRSRYNSTYMDPSLLNPEQSVNDMKSAYNQQLRLLSTVNPIIANSQSNDIYGQLLNQIPQVRSNYDNQNAQILNNVKQFNTQNKNQETLTNMQNDQNYYRESIIGNQNYDNMKNYLMDRFMDNRMRDVELNQSLSYKLLQENNPAWRFDYRTGQFLRNPKSILDVKGDSKRDIMSTYLDKLLGNWDNLDSKNKVDLMKILTFWIKSF